MWGKNQSKLYLNVGISNILSLQIIAVILIILLMINNKEEDPLI